MPNNISSQEYDTTKIIDQLLKLSNQPQVACDYSVAQIAAFTGAGNVGIYQSH